MLYLNIQTSELREVEFKINTDKRLGNTPEFFLNFLKTFGTKNIPTSYSLKASTCFLLALQFSFLWITSTNPPEE